MASEKPSPHPSASAGQSPPGTATLRELRALVGMRQADLSLPMGVQQSVISRLERSPNPSISQVQSYVAALGGHLTLTALFSHGAWRLEFGDEEPPPSR